MSTIYDMNKENTVERALTLAEQSGILRLSKRALKSFPSIAAKFNLCDLLTLDLSQNKLTDYPKQLSNCPFLSVSNCCHNLLKSLPDEFDQLCSLVQLDLSYNSMAELPRSMCRLQQLQVLIICNNKLTRLSDDCGDLINLVVLDASNNEIQSASARLVNLRQLRVLKLRNNALESVPNEWRHLRLHCLDLSVNQLTALPSEYSDMQSCLTQLSLDLNPMSSPPPHVCSRGPSHVLKYLAACRSGSELPWHYAKAGRRHQKNYQAALITSKVAPSVAEVAALNPTAVQIAVTEDLHEFNDGALSPIPQLSQRRISTVSSCSSSTAATQHSTGSLQFSSSNSVMQRLEQQSNRLGGSSTLPRRRPGVGTGAAAVGEVDDDLSVGSVSSSVSASSSVAVSAADSSDALRPADASAVAAMRTIVERRLRVRLPDRPDRLAERLIDGQLLGQLAELAGQDGDVATSVSPGGHGRLLELYQRLGISELPAAQTHDPVMKHLVRMSRAVIALEVKIKRNQPSSSNGPFPFRSSKSEFD